MAQKFLAELLKIENTVPKDKDDAKRCCICLEDYGTLDSTTGSVELPVRLPGCKHLVGTVCIAKWFGENNSCPACRKTFFPAQPRPYLEHGIFNEELRTSIERVANPVMTGDFMRDQALRDFIRGTQRLQSIENAPSEERTISDETIPAQLISSMCHVLGLGGYQLWSLAQALAEPVAERLQDEVHSPACNAALSVYIAIHLLGLADEHSQFLTDLPTLHVDPDHILATWRLVYPHRRGLIVPEVLVWVGGNALSGLFSFLPIPESILDGIANTEANNGQSMTLSDADAVEDWLSELVGEDDPSNDIIEAIIDTSDTLLDWMTGDAQEEMVNYTGELSTYSEVQIRAVCIYIACHLMGVAVTYLEVALVHQVSECSVRQLYTHVYNWKDYFIQSELIGDMVPGSVERILRASPPLTWPSQY